MSRSRNLTPSAIEQVVSILDGCSGRLTWDLLIVAVSRHLRSTYTRQALHKHERIRHAFALRKQVLTASPALKKASSPELQVAADRIALGGGKSAPSNGK